MFFQNFFFGEGKHLRFFCFSYVTCCLQLWKLDALNLAISGLICSQLHPKSGLGPKFCWVCTISIFKASGGQAFHSVLKTNWTEEIGWSLIGGCCTIYGHSFCNAIFQQMSRCCRLSHLHPKSPSHYWTDKVLASPTTTWTPSQPYQSWWHTMDLLVWPVV